MVLSPFFLAVGDRIFVTPTPTGELPIVQKTYDLIKWYVPILNRLPRDHKFGLGDRMVAVLYDLLEGFITARYAASFVGFRVLPDRIRVRNHTICKRGVDGSSGSKQPMVRVKYQNMTSPRDFKAGMLTCPMATPGGFANTSFAM